MVRRKIRNNEGGQDTIIIWEDQSCMHYLQFSEDLEWPIGS